MNLDNLKNKAKNIRINLLKAIHQAGSGHPGGSLSATDILTYLYFEEMNIDPKNPNMEKRDKFVLSKGHSAPALYATLGERGYFDVAEIMNLRKIGGKFQGHPSMSKVEGVEMSTGSLGQGISVSVGMALASKLDDGGRVYTLLGDGEIQEGIVWESLMSASHYKLDNLVVIVDWNGLQIDGKNDDVMKVTPIDEKFKAFGFECEVVDGHSFEELDRAFKKAKTVKEKPFAIICKTFKGKGVSFMEDNAGWHGKAPNNDELQRALKEIGGNL